MDGEDIGRNPGRLRRSTERSRENIREYVKLLGKRGSNAGSPRGAKGNSPSSQKKVKSPINAQTNEKLAIRKKGVKTTNSSSGPKKHSPNKDGKEAQINPKARRKLSIDKKEGKKSVKRNIAEKRVSRNKGSSRKKNVRSLGAPENSDLSNNSGLESEIENSLPDLNDINTSSDSFRGFVSDDSQDDAKRNKISKLKQINSKVSISKDDEIYEHPPDLVLFLKEGRGRNKRYSEPPTLVSEGLSRPHKTIENLTSQTNEVSESKNKLQNENKNSIDISTDTKNESNKPKKPDVNINASKRRSLRGQGFSENESANDKHVKAKKKNSTQNRKNKSARNDSFLEEKKKKKSILKTEDQTSEVLISQKMTRSSSRGKMPGTRGRQRTLSAAPGKKVVANKLRIQRRNSLDSTTLAIKKLTNKGKVKKLQLGIKSVKQIKKSVSKKENEINSDSKLNFESDSDSEEFEIESKESKMESTKKEERPIIQVKGELKSAPETSSKFSSTPKKGSDLEHIKKAILESKSEKELKSKIGTGDRLKSLTSSRKKNEKVMNTEADSNDPTSGDHEINLTGTTKTKGRSFSPEVRLIGKSLSESQAVKVILGPAGDKLVQAVPLSHFGGKTAEDGNASAPVMTFIMKKIDTKKSNMLKTLQTKSKIIDEIKENPKTVKQKDSKKAISTHKNEQNNKSFEQKKNYNIHKLANNASVLSSKELGISNSLELGGNQVPDIMDFSDIGTSEIVLGESDKEKDEIVGDLEQTKTNAASKSVLGELDLMANESLGSSSEENSRSEVPIEELLKSPESKVALDHSYSSGGSTEKSEPSSISKKKRIKPFLIDENASLSKNITEKEDGQKDESPSSSNKSIIIEKLNISEKKESNRSKNESSTLNNIGDSSSSNSKLTTSVSTTPSTSVSTPNTTVVVANTSINTTSNIIISPPSQQKKGTTPEKSPHSISRPVYSSVSLAKRSLDIMLHNDKINILRQMSQIFNNEKPATDDEETATPDAESQSSSDDDDDDDDLEKGEKEESNAGAKVDSLNRIEKKLPQRISVSTSTDNIKRLSKSTVKTAKFDQLSGKIVNESPVKNAISTLTQNTTFSPPRKNNTSKKLDVEIEERKSEVQSSAPPKLLEENKSDFSEKKSVSSKSVSNITNVTPDSKNLESDKSVSSCISSTLKKPTKGFCDNERDNRILVSNQAMTPKKVVTDMKSSAAEKDSLILSSKSVNESMNISNEDTITNDETIPVHNNRVLATKSKEKKKKSEQKSKLEKESIGSSRLINELFEDNSRSSHQSDITEANISAPENGADPDEIHPKVYHVPAYNVCLEEQIQVENTTTKCGEPVDIVDGFTFISFESAEDMAGYTQKEEKGGEAGWVHPRKRRRRRRKKKFLQSTIENASATNSQSILPGSPQVPSPMGTQQVVAAEEEELVELSKYSAERERRLQLSLHGAPSLYPMPDFTGTQTERSDLEKGKEQMELPHDQKTEDTKTSEENKSADMDKENVEQDNSEPPLLYEEVPAVDILYPRQKYKYYYNKELCKETKADARNVFVRRAGKLVPLNSIFKNQKTNENNKSNKKATAELVYIYDGGRLLTLGGSLTKINPSNSGAVKARVVLPKGVPALSRIDPLKARERKVQPVEINEDLAKFALSALKSPVTKNWKEEKEIQEPSDESKPISIAQESIQESENKDFKKEEKAKTKSIEFKLVKPDKSNILDIIAAKLRMADEEIKKDSEIEKEKEKLEMESKEEKLNSEKEKELQGEEILEHEDTKDKGINICDIKSTALLNLIEKDEKISNEETDMGKENGEICEKALVNNDSNDSSKSQENSDNSGTIPIQKKIFKKNIYRFPSLSREMKRLNMNFVNVPAVEDEIVPEETSEPCNNEHCKMGCICDSIRCKKKNLEHCGRLDCMFECQCRDESWKMEQQTEEGGGKMMNAASIFNLDREQQAGLAVREKDFKRTVISTGSEVIVVGGERRKREIKLPERYRDAADDSSPSNAHSDTDSITGCAPGIPPCEYRSHIKRCSLTVPWYDVGGISVWCMDHSCYDCLCLTDMEAFQAGWQYTSDEEDNNSAMALSTKSPSPPVLSPICGQPATSASPVHEQPATSVSPVRGQSPVAVSRDEEDQLEPVCVVIDVNVTNTEARRNYCWKVKNWLHSTHQSARTCGYDRKKILQESKRLTLNGLSGLTGQEPIFADIVTANKEIAGRSGVALETMGRQLLHSLKTGNPADFMQQIPLIDLTHMKSNAPSKQSVDNETIQQRRLSCTSDTSQESIASTGAATGVTGDDQPLKRKLSPTRPTSAANTAKLEQLQKQESNDGIKCIKVERGRRQQSLLEMMMSEERRGELELDLSSNQPGNALLVAEARFRKLINMNIIGVLGLNKSGRCIIGCVDSGEALERMHRIHSMISSSTLDVGPNMREIFFPPPHATTKPRFVMIRCDQQRKWEIVGVVQKKESECGSSSDISPGRLGRVPTAHKTTSPSATAGQHPQVIDLEEEEYKTKSCKSAEVLVLNSDDEDGSKKHKNECSTNIDGEQQARNTGTNEEGQYEITSSRANEGVRKVASDIVVEDGEDLEFPVISTEHSGQDTELSLLRTEGSPGKGIEKAKSIPDLVPIQSSSEDSKLKKSSKKLNLDSKLEIQEVENITRISSDGLSKNFTGTNILLQPTKSPSMSPQPISPASATTNFASAINMKTIKLNQASNRVFGEVSTASTSLPFTSICWQPNVKNVQKQQPVMSVMSPPRDKFTQPIGLGTIDQLPGSPITLTPISKDEQSVSSLRPKSVAIMPTTTAEGPPTEPARLLYVPTVSSAAMNNMLLPSISPNTTTAPSTMLRPHNVANVTTSPSETVDRSRKMVLLPSASDPQLVTLVHTQGPDAKEGKSSSSVHLGSAEPKPDFINTITSKQKTPEKHNAMLVDSGLNTLTISKIQSPKKGSPLSVKQSSPKVMLPTAGSLTTQPSPTITTSTNTSVTSTTKTTMGSLSSVIPVTQGNKNLPSTSNDVVIGTSGTLAELNELIKNSQKELVKQVDNNMSAVSSKAAIERESGEVVEESPRQKVKTSLPKPLLKGQHWSAVDLSLNFKSIKLEWLLGTIRKNVLLNIYRMSKKTNAPVTLSVKNGESASMLYGLARRAIQTEDNLPPILLLGSVQSYVVNASAKIGKQLFIDNTVKYFIREDTGELSSYIYDDSGDYLVKIASKKKGDGGKMIGIGNKFPVKMLQDPNCTMLSLTAEDSMSQQNSHSAKSDTERNTSDSSAIPNSSSAISSPSKKQPTAATASVPTLTLGSTGTQINTNSRSTPESTGKTKSGCNCIAAGNNICLGHSDKKNLLSGEPPICPTPPQTKSISSITSPKFQRAGLSILSPKEVTTTSLSQPSSSIDENSDVDVDIEECTSTGKDILTELRAQVSTVSPVSAQNRNPHFTPPIVTQQSQKRSLEPNRPSQRSKKSKQKDYTDDVSNLTELSHTAEASPTGSGSSGSQYSSDVKKTFMQELQGRYGYTKSAALVTVKDLEAKYVDGGGADRTELHNELERMRRRVMKQLFENLALKINGSNPEAAVVPKISILQKAQKEIEELKRQENRLTKLENYYRTSRSSYIKELATCIADASEEVRTYSKNWVRENLGYPSARVNFEKTWSPTDLDCDPGSSNSSSVESEVSSPSHGGSTGSIAGRSSPATPTQVLLAKRKMGTMNRFGKNIEFKKKKKIKKVSGPEVILDGTSSGTSSEMVSTTSKKIESTSILLMAGMSSRGRKIVRKEDSNFVTK